MVKIPKEKLIDMACMAIQDLIKYKRMDIHRYNGLQEFLENARVIPSDYGVTNVVADLISQSTDHERKLRTMAAHIKCEFIKKELKI